MKKILSVVLAGAMILGMSVTSFAKVVDYNNGSGSSDVKRPNDQSVIHSEDLTFGQVSVNKGTPVANYTNDLEGGDVLYFEVKDMKNGNQVVTGNAGQWKIKINNAEYVDGAEFYTATANDATGNNHLVANNLYVKVTLENDFDNFDEDVEFYFYITEKGYKDSDRASVSYKYKGLSEEELRKSDLDWVLNVDKAKTYKYKKGEKAATATLDMKDVLAELKMFPGEKYSIDPDLHYDKDLSREYGVDVELLTVRDDMETLFFKADKDNKVIVALDKHGDLVEVDAKYVTDYKFGSGKRVDGYLVENVKYGKYAKVSNKIKLEDKKEEDKVDENASKPTTDTSKPNPAMGANDFVGAAVALAVVSVAAAGALSLKK